MTSKLKWILSIITIIFFTSCGSSNRVSGWVTGEGGWASVLISDKISYDLAFDEVTSIISRKFEIDMITKDAGYVRTKWKTNWVAVNGEKPRKDYRVRITVKMSDVRKKVDINAEAEKLIDGFWVTGYDTQLLETMRKDIAGVVGF
jgi:hypothetical protein